VNLDKIFRTLIDFLNEYNLPDTYATAFPHETHPSLTLVYSGRTGDDLTSDLLWRTTGDEDGEVASIVFDGLDINIVTVHQEQP